MYLWGVTTNGGAGFGYGAAPVVAPPPTLADNIRHALRLLERQREFGVDVGAEPTKRLRCLLNLLLADPGADDRIIRYHKLWSSADLIRRGGLSPAHFDFLITRARSDLERLTPGSRERHVLSVLQNLDFQIRQAVWWLDYQMKAHGAAMSRGMVEVKDWMRQRQLDPRSVYSCYGGKRA